MRSSFASGGNHLNLQARKLTGNVQEVSGSTPEWLFLLSGAGVRGCPEGEEGPPWGTVVFKVCSGTFFEVIIL